MVNQDSANHSATHYKTTQSRVLPYNLTPWDSRKRSCKIPPSQIRYSRNGSSIRSEHISKEQGRMDELRTEVNHLHEEISENPDPTTEDQSMFSQHTLTFQGKLDQLNVVNHQSLRIKSQKITTLGSKSYQARPTVKIG